MLSRIRRLYSATLSSPSPKSMNAPAGAAFASAHDGKWSTRYAWRAQASRKPPRCRRRRRRRRRSRCVCRLARRSRFHAVFCDGVTTRCFHSIRFARSNRAPTNP